MNAAGSAAYLAKRRAKRRSRSRPACRQKRAEGEGAAGRGAEAEGVLQEKPESGSARYEEYHSG